MARSRTAADDEALLRLIKLVDGDLKEFNRWVRTVYKPKRGRPHMADRLDLDTIEQLAQLRGRQRTKAIRQLIGEDRIRGDGVDASTVARFKLDLRELEKTSEQLAAALRAKLNLIRTN
jgi:hypothetical protein